MSGHNEISTANERRPALGLYRPPQVLNVNLKALPLLPRGGQVILLDHLPALLTS